jgi:FkbM family methyltransferase
MGTNQYAMKAKLFEFVRNKFHPLHRLRKSRFFRERVLPLLDWDVAVQGEFAQKIYVKAITHSSIYMASGALEPGIKSLFLSLLEKVPPGSLFFDVGANIGLYTWLAAGARQDLKIVSFEPDPENFRLLTKTAKAWGVNNVHLRRMGVSDVCGTATFKRDTITSATGSLEQAGSFGERHFGSAGESIQVPITSIDTVAAAEGLPAIIKIDVEGHEPKVFAGAWATIQKARPVIFFEFYSADPAILSRLIEYGYDLFDADHGGTSNARTLNFVAVQSASPLAAVVREHLADVAKPKE